MVSRQWSRETLLKWAHRLEIRVPLGTSDRVLQQMVMRAPAPAWQWLDLYDTMANRNIGLPPATLTFEQAIMALEILSTADNTFFLEVMRLQEGDVLFVGEAWGMLQFVSVMRVYGASNQCKLRIVPVLLKPDNNHQYKPCIAGSERTIHPWRLYLIAVRVNLEHFNPSDWRYDDDLDSPPF